MRTITRYATRHATAGADVSHRGGEPRFVRVPDPARVLIPDYSGNMMFNTLGNLQHDPRAGLLFVDFDNGDLLYVAARAEIVWDGPLVASFDGAQRVSTLHDMRFVFFDNDTRILFATTYDGDWDAYINDFATKIPELMDLLFQSVEGWPGIADPSVKDFIARHQIDAAGWFVANPQVTVVDVRRLQRMEKAVNEMMDEVAGTDLDNSGPKALKAFLDKMSQPEGVDY